MRAIRIHSQRQNNQRKKTRGRHFPISWIDTHAHMRTHGHFVHSHHFLPRVVAEIVTFWWKMLLICRICWETAKNAREQVKYAANREMCLCVCACTGLCLSILCSRCAFVCGQKTNNIYHIIPMVTAKYTRSRQTLNDCGSEIASNRNMRFVYNCYKRSQAYRAPQHTCLSIFRLPILQFRSTDAARPAAVHTCTAQNEQKKSRDALNHVFFSLTSLIHTLARNIQYSPIGIAFVGPNCALVYSHITPQLWMFIRMMMCTWAEYTTV